MLKMDDSVQKTCRHPFTVLTDFSVSLKKILIAEEFLKLPGDSLNKYYIHTRQSKK